VVVYPGYRLGVFARNATGNVVTLSQASEGAAFPATWTRIGDRTTTGAPSAVISPLTGITEITARGDNGMIYNVGEESQGSGTWRSWQQVSFEESATDPTAFTYTNANGPTWAYSFRTNSNQTRVYEVEPTNSSFGIQSADGDAKPAPTFTRHELPGPPQR
jgi:hypothetical protein